LLFISIAIRRVLIYFWGLSFPEAGSFVIGWWVIFIVIIINSDLAACLHKGYVMAIDNNILTKVSLSG
jgi:hypothetical protein